MKTADLQDALLDYWVARAEGIKTGFENGECAAYGIPKGRQIKVWTAYSPSTDWTVGGPLIEKYRLTPQYRDYGGWRVDIASTTSLGDTPLQAICRAVVRAAFGDEVDEVLS